MGQVTDTEFIYGVAPTTVALETVKAIEQGYRVIAHQGGTRSGKTYGIQDVLISYAFTTDLAISVTSISLPHLKKGAMRDWRELMEAKGDYNPALHNMTDQTYQYPLGGYIEFFSVDDSKRVRGPGRDILHINEANLLSYDTFIQLMLRTKKAVILDWNPSEEFHWIYDKVLTRDDCKFIQTTYKNNPFLSIEQVREIERLKDVDPNYWKVFGLGEKGTNEATIYTHWKLTDRVPEGDVCYGLDFGYRVPTALVRQTMNEEIRYWEECLYETSLTTPDLIEKIKPIVGYETVYCDAAEPDRIAELQNAGISAEPADKNVKMGIDEVQSKPLFITKESVNLQKEIRTYKWKQDSQGRILKDDPIKINDHIMDAGRYAALTRKNNSFEPTMGVTR